MARQNLTQVTKEKVSVVAIDKLKQLKRKYNKHPEIRRGEYAIGRVRSNSNKKLVITLEYPENFIVIAYLDVKELQVRPHNLMIEEDTNSSKLQKENTKAFKREINKTIKELQTFLVKHYRKESKKVKKPIKKHVMESKWVRWRDYA